MSNSAIRMIGRRFTRTILPSVYRKTQTSTTPELAPRDGSNPDLRTPAKSSRTLEHVSVRLIQFGVVAGRDPASIFLRKGWTAGQVLEKALYHYVTFVLRVIREHAG